MRILILVPPELQEKAERWVTKNYPDGARIHEHVPHTGLRGFNVILFAGKINHELNTYATFVPLDRSVETRQQIKEIRKLSNVVVY